MFGIFKKSPERIAEALFPDVLEAADNIVKHNHLQFTGGTPGHTRFVIGAHLFSSLVCEDTVMSGNPDRVRALDICQHLKELQIAASSRFSTGQVRVRDIIVWDDELAQVRRHPINPKLAEADLNSVSLPVAEIVRELHVVRLSRMTTDIFKGATAMQEHRGPLALLTPACSTLIMQITADMRKAADEGAVAGFAASMAVQWMLLQTSVQEALK
ncbi:MAG TPA: hypothetical protein VNT99_01520 [Methylomirabilota bacterium]|nr:hypothetical protein [Methylomirabilota bacterium]